MKKLYVIRHGKTSWNLMHKIQGRTDIALCDEGREASLEVKDKLKDIKFDICFSSPLKRAKETADIICDNKVNIILDDLLLERNFGEYEGTINNYDLVEKMWDYKLNYSEKGLESILDLLQRGKEFIDKIKSLPYDNILIVTHACMIKSIYYNIHGYNENTDFLEFYVNNSDITELEI